MDRSLRGKANRATRRGRWRESFAKAMNYGARILKEVRLRERQETGKSRRANKRDAALRAAEE